MAAFAADWFPTSGAAPLAAAERAAITDEVQTRDAPWVGGAFPLAEQARFVRPAGGHIVQCVEAPCGASRVALRGRA